MHTARLPGQTRVRGVTARPVRAKFGLMPRTTALPAVLRRPRLACGAALAAVALGVQAAPVDLDSALAAPDPYELVARRTAPGRPSFHDAAGCSFVFRSDDMQHPGERASLLLTRTIEAIASEVAPLLPRGAVAE